MNVKIGEKIKTLRRRDDVTQEKLAEALGVTSQAISRWESETGYPDIEYIPALANFFNVTIDALFGHDLAGKRRRIDEICGRFDEWKNNPYNYMAPHPSARAAIIERCQQRVEDMRQALAEFPAEEKLLLRLAQALYRKWEAHGTPLHALDEGAVAPNGDPSGHPIYEHIRSFDGWEEAAKIAEELLRASGDDELRRDCRQMLAYIYAKVGEHEKLEETINKFDPISYSREHMRVFTSYSVERARYERELLQGDVLDVISSHLINHDMMDAVRREKALRIIFDLFEHVFPDGNYGAKHQWLYSHYEIYFYLLAGAHPPQTSAEPRYDEAFAALESMYKHAKGLDEYNTRRSEEQNDGTEKTNNSLDCQHRMLRNLGIMKKQMFTKIAADPRYDALIARIEADLAEQRGNT